MRSRSAAGSRARASSCIVVACNSATAAALGDLQRALDVPVIGVLTPEARAAVQVTRSRRVGLLATEATVASGRYRDASHGLDAGIELDGGAVPGARRRDPERRYLRRDDGRARARALRAAAQAGRRHRHPRLHPLPADPRDAPARARARRRARLGGRGAGRGGRGDARAQAESRAITAARGSYRFACTGDAEAFAGVGRRFLQLPISSVRTLDAAELAGLTPRYVA